MSLKGERAKVKVAHEGICLPESPMNAREFLQFQQKVLVAHRSACAATVRVDGLGQRNAEAWKRRGRVINPERQQKLLPMAQVETPQVQAETNNLQGLCLLRSPVSCSPSF